MEIVGTVASAVTLTALFKVCIEAFDMIRAAQHQALDLKKLNLKLNIEKCRLYTWGEAMGFTSATAEETLEALELHHHSDLIQETLELILSMFKDSQKLKEKYGCMSLESGDPTKPAPDGQQTNVLQQLNASFNFFKIKSSVRTKKSSFTRKTYWVVQDRKKFEFLISEAKSLVDGLQDITKEILSQKAQQDAMSSRIRAIPDVRTLDWVSEVCEVDYPAFSDAASMRADTISDLTNFHRDIQDWKNTVALDRDDESDASSVETAIAGLEDMTVTELKHKLSSFLLRAKEDRLKARNSMESRPGVSSITSEKESTREEMEINLYSSDDTRRWGVIFDQTVRPGALKNSYELEAEDYVNEKILEGMYAATRDREFKEELTAIEKWFRVLSSGERASTFYNLGATISQDPDQRRFFTLVQNERMSSAMERRPSKDNQKQHGTLEIPTEIYRPKEQHSLSSKTNHVTAKRPLTIDPSTGKSDSLAGLFNLYSDFIKDHTKNLSDSIPLKSRPAKKDRPKSC